MPPNARLAALFTERSALEQRLAQEALPAAEIAECGRRLKAVADETARLEERWRKSPARWKRFWRRPE
ncbi:hypothetical protein D8B24_15375 [Verminephrobacter aporrectodeae subsp. tuberculatae]|nr:hypothetical protein [Verminephrobacter aporrectodeae subsp. tuberculatae]